MKLNNKARYTLICALSKNEYEKVCRLNTAKEIWDSLRIDYEENEDTQSKKVITLTLKYEFFTMR